MSVTVEPGLDLGECLVTEDRVRRYLEAVEDQQRVYFDHSLIPPVAMTAWALGAILDKLALPDGAIHSSQELETLGGARFPGVYGITVDPGKPRQRGNLVFLTVSYSLVDAEGRIVQRGKSTVLSTGQTHGSSASQARSRPVAQESGLSLAAKIGVFLDLREPFPNTNSTPTPTLPATATRSILTQPLPKAPSLAG